MVGRINPTVWIKKDLALSRREIVKLKNQLHLQNAVPRARRKILGMKKLGVRESINKLSVPGM
jgi:hypothetical protein